MLRVLYPGSFDPITKGHMSIINQATILFDEIYVGVLQNPNKKNYFFTPTERVEIIKQLYEKHQNIKVLFSDYSAVDLAKSCDCKAIIRGLRSITDFEYEIQLAQVNKDISDNEINTICLFADSNLQNISSSVVKEILNLNKDISKYVDYIVEEKMKQKILKR